MNNEQKGPWLFRVGDYTTQLYGDYNKLNDYKDPY